MKLMQIESRQRALALAVAGIAVVGAIDYFTGVEIRVFPLYFFPLVLAACNLGVAGGLLLSLLASLVWLASMYFGGREYSRFYVWPINFLTQGSAFVVVALLVSHLKKVLRREAALSRTDALTGLHNSRAFYENSQPLLAMCHRSRRALALAYVDLDHFKRANDTLGHLHGDEVLRKAAGIFREHLRASDLAARLGGDEFAVLLPETDAAGAAVVLEKIRQALCRDPEFQKCGVTASIGAVCFPLAPLELEPVVQKADETMYKVKAQGKNRVLVETV